MLNQIIRRTLPCKSAMSVVLQPQDGGYKSLAVCGWIQLAHSVLKSNCKVALQILLHISSVGFMYLHVISFLLTFCQHHLPIFQLRSEPSLIGIWDLWPLPYFNQRITDPVFRDQALRNISNQLEIKMQPSALNLLDLKYFQYLLGLLLVAAS